jgi:UDP-3-O-[3-hydroxymyristoyl] glucosamine N-acyltransferase
VLPGLNGPEEKACMSDPVFFLPSRRYSAGEIASLTGAQLADSAHSDTIVSTIASAASGGEGALVFVEGKRNAALLDRLNAAAVLVTPDIAGRAPSGIAVLVTPAPQRAFAMVGRLLYPEGLGLARSPAKPAFRPPPMSTLPPISRTASSLKRAP